MKKISNKKKKKCRPSVGYKAGRRERVREGVREGDKC